MRLKYLELQGGETADFLENCVGLGILMRGFLTFMRECDSLHPKITRSQRLSKAL